MRFPGSFCFWRSQLPVASRSPMRSSVSTTHSGAPVDVRWRALFEDRYGADGLDRLLKLFAQPCVTFATIAERFGVTRERVRQWHLQLLPDAPRGHERQRLCWLHHQKRQVLLDPLFRSFYGNARRCFQPGHLNLMHSRNGFRRRAALLHSGVVLVRQAPLVSRTRSVPTFTLRVGHTPCDFIYYRLSDNDFLFVPRSRLPVVGTNYVDNGRSKYVAFRNSFESALSIADLANSGQAPLVSEGVSEDQRDMDVSSASTSSGFGNAGAGHE